MGERSFYLSDFTDEMLVCDPALEGWAAWLASPEQADDGFRHGSVVEGQTFKASATLWKDDIIATRENGEWSLSRAPQDGEFIAVRFGDGLGWGPDQIIDQEIEFNSNSGGYALVGTLRDALLKWLGENSEFCEDEEFIACGTHEDGWMVTFHAGPPPSCTAERMQ